MSKIFVSKKLFISKSTEPVIVAQRIQTAIAETFDKHKSSEPFSFEVRVKTNPFNPVVSVVGKIDVITQNENGEILITADTKTNGWFWVTFLILCIPPFTGWGLLLLGWMWYSQEKSSKRDLEGAIDKMVFDLNSNHQNSISNKNNENGSLDTSGNVYDQIEKLHKLKMAGALTEDEFQKERSKLLAQL